MSFIELPRDEIAKARLSIMAELQQDDRTAANRAFKTLLQLISSTWVILQGCKVRGTNAIRRCLNVIIVLNRVLLSLVIVFVIVGIAHAPGYLIGAFTFIAAWWLLNQVQFRLNIELGARFKALQAQMVGQFSAMPALVDAIRESLRAITRPRFYETERGYQGELLAEIRKRLPSIDVINDDVVIEQEFQKQDALHGLRLRPDLVIHVPFDITQHVDRRQGNYVCFELKLRATEAEAREAYRKLSQLMLALHYPVSVFVNIDSSVTHISAAPRGIGKVFAFAVSLQSTGVDIQEEST